MSKTTLKKKAEKAEKKVTVEATNIATETKKTDSEVAISTPEVKKEIKKASRGKQYIEAKKKIKVDRLYTVGEAVALAKSTHIAKFVGKLEAHIVTLNPTGTIGDITLPHIDLGTKKVVIASDTIIAQIKEGKIDFDILVATPAVMPKLLPFSRTLGPKGLLPNAKNGTLTDKPEDAVKKLSVAKIVLKTEKTAPVVHLVVGRLDQADKELIANVEELIKVLNPTKIKKLVLASTMGPGIKVQIGK